MDQITITVPESLHRQSGNEGIIQTVQTILVSSRVSFSGTLKIIQAKTSDVIVMIETRSELTLNQKLLLKSGFSSFFLTWWPYYDHIDVKFVTS